MHRVGIILTVVVLSVLQSSIGARELMFDFSQNRETYFWGDSLAWEPSIGGKTPLLLTNRSSATLVQGSLLLGDENRWQEDYRSALEWRLSRGGRFRISPIISNNYRSSEERVLSENSAGVKVSLTPMTNLLLDNTASFLTVARSNYGHRDRSNGFEDVTTLAYKRSLGRSTGFDVNYRQDLRVLPDVPTSSLVGDAAFWSFGSIDSLEASLEGELQNNRYFTDPRSFEAISRQRKVTSAGSIRATTTTLGTRVQLLSKFDLRQYRYRHDNASLAGISTGLLGSDNSATSFEYKLTVLRDITRRLGLGTYYYFRESTEDYGSLSAKQKVRTGECRFLAVVRPAEMDSVYAEAIFSVTGYYSDRPGTFFSDRDRLMRYFGAGIAHSFNPFLSISLGGSYRGFHQTYVSGTLSANNNHNVVYVVTSDVVWKPEPWIRITNGFVLQANYLWYDYEKVVGSDRNTLFRRAQWRSGWKVTVSQRLELEPSYSYRYEDFGQLFWRDQWVQKTNWDRRSHLPAFELTYRPVSGIMIRPSVSQEWKRSWEYQAAEDGSIRRVQRERFSRLSTQLEVEYSPGPKTDISLAYERRVQKSMLFSDDTSSQVIVSVKRRF